MEVTAPIHAAKRKALYRERSSESWEATKKRLDSVGPITIVLTFRNSTDTLTHILPTKGEANEFLKELKSAHATIDGAQRHGWEFEKYTKTDPDGKRDGEMLYQYDIYMGDLGSPLYW